VKSALVRRLATVAVVFAAVLIPLSTASAHAGVVRSDPPDNAVLATSPRQVRLWFSEPISPKFTSVQLLNARSENIKPTRVGTDPAQRDLLVLDLPELPPGVYNLAWKTLSDADGHFAEGHIVFGVGASVGASSAAGGVNTEALPWAEALVRWLSYATLIALLGAVAIVFLIFDPALRAPGAKRAGIEAISETRARVWGWAAFLALAALCAGAVALAGQAARTTLASGALLPSGDDSVVLAVGELLTQTRWGMWWLARQAILLAMLVVTYQMANATLAPDRQIESATDHERKTATGKARRQKRSSSEVTDESEVIDKSKAGSALPKVLLLTGLGLALAASQVLSGHAAALTPNTAAAVGAGTIHLLAASVWVGGVLALSIGLLPLMRRDEARGALLTQIGWRSFSRVAVLSVALVVATGLYSAGREVASLDAAITTPYGRALLGKIALVLGVGFLGLLNSSLLHPRLAAPLAGLLRRPPGWTPLRPAQLPRLGLAEAGLGLLVLLARGLLTSSSPAHGAQFAPAPVQAGPSVLSLNVEDLLVTMEAQPNQPGSNLVTIRVAPAGNAAPGEILRVIARFTYSNQDIGTVPADASETAAGVYQVTGSQLSIAGPWKVQVAVRRKGLEDSVAIFNWTVAAPPRPVLVSDRPLEPGLTLTAMLMLALATGTGVALWLRSRGARTHAVMQLEREGTHAGRSHK